MLISGWEIKYVKLKNQYTDINYGSLRIGGIYVNSYNEGAVGRLSQNDYKMFYMLPVQLWEKIFSSSYDSRFGFDANINTLVELSDVQFTEAAMGRHYFEATNNGWCDQLEFDR
jgi:hypothetical protein